MTTASLEFLKNEADEAEGLSDAGIETFRDSPFAGVAREAGQNSRDARVADQPVVMTFEKIAVPTESFPAIDRYRDAAARCLAFAQEARDEKEIEFFTQATAALSADEISILRISDFNTRGLEGPCVTGQPFHSLVKATGVSSKDTETSGGSFGIGKSAVYAASDIQTAFYSTLYRDERGTLQFLSQGKTRFRSFVDASGVPRRSVGYWGVPNAFLPVSISTEVPTWLRREEVGTTICAIAMRESSDWQNAIIASAIQNFFCAIHRGEMEFKIDNVSITKNTLLQLFERTQTKAAAIAAGNEEDYSFSRAMYDCLRLEDDSTEKIIEVNGAGKFRVKLLLRDNLPKRVGFIRNGMYITDNLKHFGHKFQKFPMYRDFVAIVEPFGEQENVWLKRMENPRHDELSPERITDPAKRDATRRAGGGLAAAIRDTIKEAAKAQTKDQVDLDELSEFFAVESRGKEDDHGSPDPGTFKIKKTEVTRRKRTSKSPPIKTPGEAGGSVHGENAGHGGGGFGEGSGEGWGTKGRGSNSARRPILLETPRTVLIDQKDTSKRRIHFTPTETAEATLSFECSGLSEPQLLPVSSEPVKVRCMAGERQYVDVTFLTPYDGPIEIVSWVEGDPSDEN